MITNRRKNFTSQYIFEAWKRQTIWIDGQKWCRKDHFAHQYRIRLEIQCAQCRGSIYYDQCLGNIEGLPTNLKTVYVQHDDASDDKGLSLVDEMMQGRDMIEANVNRGSYFSLYVMSPEILVCNK